MKNQDKNFPYWLRKKSEIHFTNRIRSFNEGDVWWAGIGENVGIEINGKSNSFSRPIVVLKKFNRYGFLAIPFTSQIHQGSWWTHIEFQGKHEYACLTQSRILSVARLYSKIGELPENDLEKIREAYLEPITK